VLEKIVAAWEPVYDRSDIVVVEGLSAGPDRLYASGLNQALARALDADVVLAGSCRTRTQGAASTGLAAGGARARRHRGHCRGPGRDADHSGGRIPVRRARARGRLRGLQPAGGGSLSGRATARGAVPRGLRLIAAIPHRPSWAGCGSVILSRAGPRVLSEGDLSRRIKDVAVFAQGVPGASAF